MKTCPRFTVHMPVGEWTEPSHDSEKHACQTENLAHHLIERSSSEHNMHMVVWNKTLLNRIHTK